VDRCWHRRNRAPHPAERQETVHQYGVDYIVFHPRGRDLKIDFHKPDGRKSDRYTLKDVVVERGRTLFINHRFY